MQKPFKVLMFAVTLMLLFSALPTGVMNQSSLSAFASDRAGYQVDMTYNFAGSSIGMICQEPKNPPPNCLREIEDPCANFGPNESTRPSSSPQAGTPPDTRSKGQGDVYLQMNRRAYTSYRPEPEVFWSFGYSPTSVSQETKPARKVSNPSVKTGRTNNEVESKTCQPSMRD